MGEQRGDGPVIAGVHPAQDAEVVAEAARLADALGRPLVCAYVTEDSYLVEWDRPEAREDASLHPDDVGPDDERVGLDLAARVTAVLGEETPVDGWTLRLLGGDPAKALARLADEVDARLLVVGTHQRGFAHALEERLGGSVALKLARDQRRAVVVVPVTRSRREDDARIARL